MYLITVKKEDMNLKEHGGVMGVLRRKKDVITS